MIDKKLQNLIELAKKGENEADLFILEEIKDILSEESKLSEKMKREVKDIIKSTVKIPDFKDKFSIIKKKFQEIENNPRIKETIVEREVIPESKVEEIKKLIPAEKTPEEIVKSIESLTGEDRLSFDALKDVPNIQEIRDVVNVMNSRYTGSNIEVFDSTGKKVGSGSGIQFIGATVTHNGNRAVVTVTGGGGGTPAAPDTSIQWNNAGAFGGSADFTYDDTDKIMTLDTIKYRQDVQNSESLVPNVNLFITNNDITPSFAAGGSPVDSYDLAIGKNLLYTVADPVNNSRYPGDFVMGINILQNAESPFNTGDNIAIGFDLMNFAGAFGQNIVIGKNILNEVAGFGNIGIGLGVFHGRSVDASNTIAIGSGSCDSSTGTDNIAIGSNSFLSSDATSSIGIGLSTFQSSDSIQSIAIGVTAGQGETFDRVILLGEAARANADRQFVVGYSFGGSTDGNITSLRIGINNVDTNGLIYSLQTTGTNLAYNTSSPRLRVGGTGLPTNASALAEFNSTTQALLLPRMTTAQRDAIATPVAGMIIYNTTTSAFNGYNGAWVAL